MHCLKLEIKLLNFHISFPNVLMLFMFFFLFKLTSEERHLRANDREFNLSFKYAVSRNIYLLFLKCPHYSILKVLF